MEVFDGMVKHEVKARETGGEPRDVLGRLLRDLRISVTDRCNMRCRYCMPAEIFGPDYAFVSGEDILTFKEIERVVRVMTGLGVRKVRLTGGEPLLRRGIADLVSIVSKIPGVEDIALTTNGLVLAELAEALKAAGLMRVSVSLDSLDNGTFQSMGGTRRPVGDVVKGMMAAKAAGLPVKVNCVVKREVNEGEVLPLVEFCRREGFTLRLIEFMDVGNHNGWKLLDVVPSAELRDLISRRYPLESLPPLHPGEVARRWRFVDGNGEIGFISSITEPFCRGCNRARLTTEGRLVTCLFASGGADVRSELRGGKTDAEIAAFLRGIWEGRSDRYSELRKGLQGVPIPKVEMSYVGG